MDELSGELKTVFLERFNSRARDVVRKDSCNKFHDHLVGCNLITYRRQPSDYDSVIHDIFSLFDLCDDSVDRLEKICQQFLFALLLLGSPESTKLSRELRKEWNSKAKDVLGVASFVNEETSKEDELNILRKWKVQTTMPVGPRVRKENHAAPLRDYPDNANESFQVFDEFYTRIVDALCKNDIVIPFTDKLCNARLITSAMKIQVQRMSSRLIQAKAVVSDVRVIIRKGVFPKSLLENFIGVMSTGTFHNHFKHIIDGMKGKGYQVKDELINQIENQLQQIDETSATAGNLVSPLTELSSQELPSNLYKRHLYLHYQNLTTSSISAHACEWNFFELAVSEKSVTRMNKSGEALDLQCVPQKLHCPPRTLIVGGPGMGKSSIVIELCKRWYNGHSLQEYEYVILLEGHNPEISNATKLDDLVLNPEWMIPIRKADGKNSLFIIDGYEDLSEECRQQNSFIDRFISGKILREASFIVTTRPWCAKAILKYFSNEARVEILGFTQQGRKEFIEYKLKGGADDFNHYDLPMEGCSTIPFCLDALIKIYQEKRKNLQAMSTFPKTVSTVYGELICTLVVQFVDKNQKNKIFVPEIPPGEFIKFPGPIYRSFLELCAFSYTSMMQPSEQNEASPEIETFDLFKHHAIETPFGNRAYYTCLHSSIQEYLAAYCVSRMNEENRKNCIASLELANRYHLMLEFLAGFKCFIPSISSKCFSNVHDFYIFRQLCQVNSDRIIQDAFLNHVKTCVVKRTWPLPSPTDFWCLGKVLALSNRDWELGFTLRQLQNSHLKMLCEGINSVDFPNGQITKCPFSLNEFDECGIEYMFEINEECLSATKEINLCANQLNSRVIPILCVSLSKVPNLIKFVFHHNEIESGDHKPLIIDGLVRCNYLEHVSLSNLEPDECHLLLTMPIKKLKIVQLWQISPQSCKVVFDTLPKTILQQLEIHQSELDDDCFKDLHITLPQSHVTTLKLINCGIDSNMVEVIVRAAEKLSSIDLSDNIICDNGGESLLRLHKRSGIDLLETEKCNNFSDRMLKQFPFSAKVDKHHVDAKIHQDTV